MSRLKSTDLNQSYDKIMANLTDCAKEACVTADLHDASQALRWISIAIEKGAVKSKAHLYKLLESKLSFELAGPNAADVKDRLNKLCLTAYCFSRNTSK